MSTVIKIHPELEGKAPPCFTKEQWAMFVRAERQLIEDGKYVLDPSGYCAECTARYKAQMVERRRCSYPDVVFVKDEDGSTSGVRKKGLTLPESL